MTARSAPAPQPERSALARVSVQAPARPLAVLLALPDVARAAFVRVLLPAVEVAAALEVAAILPRTRRLTTRKP